VLFRSRAHRARRGGPGRVIRGRLDGLELVIPVRQDGPGPAGQVLGAGSRRGAEAPGLADILGRLDGAGPATAERLGSLGNPSAEYLEAVRGAAYRGSAPTLEKAVRRDGLGLGTAGRLVGAESRLIRGRAERLDGRPCQDGAGLGTAASLDGLDSAGEAGQAPSADIQEARRLVDQGTRVTAARAAGPGPAGFQDGLEAGRRASLGSRGYRLGPASAAGLDGVPCLHGLQHPEEVGTQEAAGQAGSRP
jgi:hypothetical protein